MLLRVSTVLSTLLIGLNAFAAIDCGALLQKLNNEMNAGAKWARDLSDGKDVANQEEFIKASSTRIIPFGRTYVHPDGTRERKVSQLFRIAQNSDVMIFLRSGNHALELLIGAPVSPHTLEMAERNSAYLLLPDAKHPEPQFQALLQLIVTASDLMKETHGIYAYAAGQNPYNREVAAIGAFALVPVDLNNAISTEQLADYLSLLWSATEGEKLGIHSFTD